MGLSQFGSSNSLLQVRFDAVIVTDADKAMSYTDNKATEILEFPIIK